ncbi:MAG: glycosyltransferase [Eubacterium sp.]|nr:glycosyltransferase [Eubacterium sp.]
MAKSKCTIPIIMATDRNYLLPTSVTVWSVLENGSIQYTYVFYFLVNAELQGMDQGLFREFQQKHPNFEYHYLTVAPEIFKEAALTNTHVTIETYYRLLIGRLLPDYDKCLYLDGDLIVQCDAAILFDIEMEENYLAAVKDIGMQCGQGSYYTDHKKELGFDSMDTYFNAGVIVFNLKKIREKDMVSRFLKAIEKKYTIEDQDILNVTCLGKVHYLPLKYNVFSGFIGRIEFINCGAYNKEDLENVEAGNIAVIHYAGGKDKPWRNHRGKKADVWWEYVGRMPKVPWADQEMKGFWREGENADFGRLLEQCRKYKQIILYGYTYISRELLMIFERYGISQVKFFCDGNKAKQGEMFKGRQCISAEKLKKVITKDTFIVICTQIAHAEVKRYLVSSGVQEKQIGRYIVKGTDYYRSLDKQYYDLELEELCRRKNVLKKSFAEQKEDILDIKKYSEYKEIIEEGCLECWAMNLPLVSIIIPAFNAEEYLHRCLESVWTQNYVNWECIIINDGSKDATAQIAQEWVYKDRRFLYFYQQNQGMGLARNRAVSLAKGEYVTFIDSDDWVEPDYVRAMFFAMAENHADVCKSNFYFHDIAQEQIWAADITDEVDVMSMKTYIHPNMWCNMFSIDLFRDNAIKMPGMPLEDLAVYPLLLLKASKVVSIAKPVYHYQINTGASVMDHVENMRYYPDAVSHLVKEAERLQILAEYQDLFMRIAAYHMIGALNSRIRKNCSEQEFEEYKKEWCTFLNETFPAFHEEYDFNHYWIWGSYNLSRIIAYMKLWNGYYLAGKDLPFYFGFTSMISLFKREKEVLEFPIETENVFRADMLDKETKCSFLEIQPGEDDYLLVDLLEERFDMIKMAENTYVTQNDMWLECSTGEKLDILKRYEKECFELWKHSCDMFISFVSERFKKGHIILVENYLAKKCKNQKGLWLLWDQSETMNAILKKYYDYFKEQMPHVLVLQIPEGMDYTDAASKYGTEPNYLNFEAHKVMAARLKEMIYKYKYVDISVVIPSFQAGTEFSVLLQALKKQKGIGNLEIIVVDSGSTDGTVQTAQKEGAKLIQISQKQFSHSYSRNLGAENAKYEYLVFMTQDAMPENELWLEELVRPLMENTGIVATTCIEQPREDADLFSRMVISQQIDWLSVKDQDRILQMPRVLPEAETFENVIRKNGCINDVACAYKKDIFLHYKYRMPYAEDLDMGKRLIFAGYKLKLLGNVKVIHSHNRNPMYYMKRMYVERIAFAEIFLEQRTVKMTEEEFIDGAVWAFDKLQSWICEFLNMPLEWSKNAVLINLKDIYMIESFHLKKERIEVDSYVQPYHELQEFIERLRNYRLKIGNDTADTGKKVFYRMLTMKLEGMIGYLWNHEEEKVSFKMLMEICETMYDLYGNVAGGLFGEVVLSGNGLRYLQEEANTFKKGI